MRNTERWRTKYERKGKKREKGESVWWHLIIFNIDIVFKNVENWTFKLYM